MPRKRRMMTKSPRPRADWVYRSDIHDEAGTLFDPWGTYDENAAALTSGDVNSIGQVLYDSHNYMASTIGASGNALVSQPRAARAEGGRAKILAFEGSIVVAPSAWALGNTFRLGLRFGAFEQIDTNGAILVPTTYNMWGDAGAPAQNVTKPAVYANTRTWDLEWRHCEAFATDRPNRFNFRFRRKTRRSLRPHECYGIYLASSPESIGLNIQFWFRTLVSDEG